MLTGRRCASWARQRSHVRGISGWTTPCSQTSNAMRVRPTTALAAPVHPRSAAQATAPSLRAAFRSRQTRPVTSRTHHHHHHHHGAAQPPPLGLAAAFIVTSLICLGGAPQQVGFASKRARRDRKERISGMCRPAAVVSCNVAVAFDPCHCVGRRLARQKGLHRIFRTLDVNKDGTVSVTNFVQFFQSTVSHRVVALATDLP